MIRVIKSSTIPKILLTKGTNENEKNKKLFNSNRALFDITKSLVKNKIYGHSSVKLILKSFQHSKCCFCEKSQKGENGAVEHFRPKGAFHSLKKEKLQKPGYYWLGYEWNNLYFVCSACNSKLYKGNLFPLKDESKRARNHNDNIDLEDPYLIEPGGNTNPRDHIVFDLHLPRGKTIYGKKTIEICGLDRWALNEDRQKHTKNIECRICILKKREVFDINTVNEAIEFINNSVKPQAEFSATAIDYLAYRGYTKFPIK
jgi:uncharacterized protein (TIGR02646 family)